MKIVWTIIEYILLAALMITSAFGWIFVAAMIIYFVVDPELLGFDTVLLLAAVSLVITTYNVRFLKNVQYRQLEIQAEEYEAELKLREDPEAKKLYDHIMNKVYEPNGKE